MDRRAFYQTYYAASRAGHWWFAGRAALVERLLQVYGIEPAPVVDLGGGALTVFPESFPTVRMDAEFLPGEDLFVQADAGRLPFAPASFQGAGLFDLLEHTERPGPLLQEVRRVLRPGGFLVVTVPAHRWLWSWHDELVGHYHRYELSELTRLLEREGFAVAWSNYFYRFLVPAALARKVFPSGVDQFRLPPAPLNRLLARVAQRSALGVLGRRQRLGLTAIALAQRP
jgi:SAM-dependent methyltransferase